MYSGVQNVYFIINQLKLKNGKEFYFYGKFENFSFKENFKEK